MAGQINLYDPALERQRDWLVLGNLAMGAALLAALVAIAGVAVRWDHDALMARAVANEQRLAAMREQAVPEEQDAGERRVDPLIEQDVARQRAQFSLHEKVLAALRGSVGDESRVAYSEYMRALARQSVDGLWLTGFRLAESGRGFEIRGRTLDPTMLPGYIRRLNREPAFRGLAFAALKIEAVVGEIDGAAPVPPHHAFALVPDRPAADRAEVAE